jgi:MFS family permease
MSQDRTGSIDAIAASEIAAGKQYSRTYLAYVTFILVLSSTFAFLDRQLINILIEPIKTEFGATDTQMGLLTGLAFVLFYVTLGIPVARLADRKSRRNVLAVAITIWSAMTAACGLASSFFQLALARIGVGIGEAGGTPPAQSMLADYFPPRLRSTVLGIFSSSGHLGMLFSMFGGALIAQHYGWRTAFLAVGIPGLFLAVLLWLTVDEPLRGRWERDGGLAAAGPQQPFAAVLRQLWQSRAFRFVALAYGVTSLSSYGMATWIPSFYIRVHGLSLLEAGMVMGVAGTLGGLFGAVLGGMLSDRLGLRDRSWQLRVAAIGVILTLPMQALLLLWPERFTFGLAGMTLPMAALFMPVSSFFNAFVLGPTFASVHTLVQPQTRAQATAILLLVSNLLGMGIGPLAVGMLSDALQPVFGDMAIRYALLCGLTVVILGGVFYWRAGTHYRRELAAITADENAASAPAV